VLVGDIGATKARLALISPEGGLAHPLRQATLPSRRFAGLESLVADFLASAAPRIDRAVLAVAGPVVGGRAELTNLSWVLEERSLRDALGITSVRLINDLVATAHAIPGLEAEALHTLQRGEPKAGGAIAVVAPGTGLGEAFLTWNGSRYDAYPSEGGHGDFAPADELQVELLSWLRERHAHVSYERVCSGLGLPTLFDFLERRGTARQAEWVKSRLAATDDRTPVIIEAAMAEREPCALSLAAVELFASILAAEAGNAALRVLATGGVYLGGGLPRRILPVLAKDAVLRRFRAKGRFTDFLASVPVHVLVRSGTALLGAARYALTTPAEVDAAR
jgi:glucokinase